ncbi:MAG: tetratricopeptide repeat protein [Prevotella ruminicola]|jgi:tetratricopeptide (TPR) repeat protein|uniref:Tetratricopeptide repeat protein n=1 Tax=Xylanibacter ruminicola TaxID=839 RepID=A0A928BS36_XYLRU|nr:tetratricopeptide repeat protein [Xylanibacter ruminicola]
MRKSVLIIVLFWTVCASAQTPKQWRDSISVLIEQINLHPKNVDLRLKKAEANINLSQYDYAAEEYSKVLKQDERNLAALYFRAYCYTQLRQYSMARADYDAFLAIQPEHLEAHLGLARVLQLLNRRADAVDELNRCVQMFPDSADAYAARAAYETQLKQYDAALYDWDEALRLRPNDASLTVSKVDVLLNLGRIREAREALDKAVKQGTTRAALREWYDKCK